MNANIITIYINTQIHIDSLKMGKKQNASQLPIHPYTAQDTLRRNSHKLQQFMLEKNEKNVKHLLDSQMGKGNISFTTFTKCNAIINGLKHSHSPLAQKRSNQEKNSEDSNSKEIEDHSKVCNQFYEMLDQSNFSYKKTSLIFSRLSLRQKYEHLLRKSKEQDNASVQANIEKSEQAITTGSQLIKSQRLALKKIKKMFKKYKVSNMFKESICSKIERHYVEMLVGKGLLSESKAGILSLKC